MQVECNCLTISKTEQEPRKATLCRKAEDFFIIGHCSFHPITWYDWTDAANVKRHRRISPFRWGKESYNFGSLIYEFPISVLWEEIKGSRCFIRLYQNFPHKILYCFIFHLFSLIDNWVLEFKTLSMDQLRSSQQLEFNWRFQIIEYFLAVGVGCAKLPPA